MFVIGPKPAREVIKRETGKSSGSKNDIATALKVVEWGDRTLLGKTRSIGTMTPMMDCHVIERTRDGSHFTFLSAIISNTRLPSKQA
jgi:hypothetical protein